MAKKKRTIPKETESHRVTQIVSKKAMTIHKIIHTDDVFSQK